MTTGVAVGGRGVAVAAGTEVLVGTGVEPVVGAAVGTAVDGREVAVATAGVADGVGSAGCDVAVGSVSAGVVEVGCSVGVGSGVLLEHAAATASIPMPNATSSFFFDSAAVDMERGMNCKVRTPCDVFQRSACQQYADKQQPTLR